MFGRLFLRSSSRKRVVNHNQNLSREFFEHTGSEYIDFGFPVWSQVRHNRRVGIPPFKNARVGRAEEAWIIRQRPSNAYSHLSLQITANPLI